MNTKTTLILLLAAAVAGLVFVIAKPWEKPPADPVPESGSKALFSDAASASSAAGGQSTRAKPEGIDRVEVILPDGRRSFAKREAHWMMLEPIEAPATGYEVDQIVSTITDLKYTRSYAKDDENRPKDNDTKLGQPLAVVRLLKGDKPEAEVTVGARVAIGTGNYFRIAPGDEIYQSETDLSGKFNKRLDSYRDRQVLRFNLQDARRVTVEGSQSYTLIKEGAEWMVETPVRARADKAKVEGLIRPLTSLSVQEWQSDDPTGYARYQLDQPRLKVTVETEETRPARLTAGDPAVTQPADTQPSVKKASYTLMVGGTTGTATNSYFARLANAPWVFSLSDYTVKQVALPLTELQDKAIAKVDQTKVKKVEIEAGGQSTTLSKSGVAWTFADGTQADATAVAGLLKAVAELRATNYADPKLAGLTGDWTKPRARLSFTMEGQVQPVTVLVGTPTASGRMVYVRNAAEEPVAAVSEDLVEPLLQPPVSYRDRLVTTVPTDRVSIIEIARASAKPVTLEKKDNKWSMRTPIEGPTDNNSVRSILGDFSRLQAKRVAGVGDKAAFGLDQPEVTVSLWIDRLSELPNAKVVGASSQPAASRPAIAPSLAPAPANQATSTQPTASQPAAADATELKRRIEKIEELLKYQHENPDREKKEVTELLEKQLAERKAQYAAATQAAPAIATQPAVVVAASQPAASQPTGPELRRLFISQKDGKTFACLDDGPTIWEMDERIHQDATAEFHDRQITSFTVADVAELSFERADGALTLRKSGDEWRYVNDPLVPIEKQKVTDVLNVLRELKTHRYTDYAAGDLGQYGLSEPSVRVVLGLSGGQRTEIRLSAAGPANDPDKSRYAVVAGSNKVFLLKEDQAKRFDQKIEDFAKPAAPAGGPSAPPPQELPGGFDLE